jgi:serine/threonine protein kinase
MIEDQLRSGEPLNLHPPFRHSAYRPISVKRGGMARVYLCVGIATAGVPFAVKRLDDDLASTPSARDAFVYEALTWLRLGQHPNIVQALTVHAAPHEAPSIVLQWVPNSLRDLLHEQRKLPVGRGFDLLGSLASGLLYSRSQIANLVHGDIKPDNILVSSGGVFKVADFGLARVIRTMAARENPDDPPPAFISDSPAGTPMYMAPELFLGSDFTEASDVYAIGCTLIEALAGAPTYGTPHSLQDCAMMHLRGRPLDLVKQSPDVPGEFADLLASCIAKSSGDRPSLQDLATFHKGRHAGSWRARRPKAEATIRPPASDIRFLASQGYFNLGKHEDAYAEAQRALATCPQKDVQLLLLLHSLSVAAAARLGNFEAAEEHERVIRDSGWLQSVPMQNRAHALNDLADMLRAKGDIEGALRLWEDALENGGETQSIIWANVASAQAALGRRGDAISAYNRAIQISANVEYFSGLYSQYLLGGEYLQALAIATVERKFHPHNALAYYHSGVSMLMAGNAGTLPVTKEMVLNDLEHAARLPASADARALIQEALTQFRAHYFDEPTPSSE